MRRSRLAAPAKVNVHLEILGRGDNRFHALETIFQTLELADEVDVEVVPGDGIALTGDDPSLAMDATNLAWRAAEAFAALTPVGGQVRIGLTKRVPAGAGLGGGSSDAAAVLRALAALVARPPAPDALAAAAATLGSDVPFFLHGGTAHATGRGEIVTPLPDLPRLPVTILKPPPPLPTPRVYAELTDAERGPRAALGAAAWRAKLADGVPADALLNRLTGPARRLEPAVDALLRWLDERRVPHLLSGSGSACFALAHLDAPPGVQAWRTWFRPRARLDAID